MRAWDCVYMPEAHLRCVRCESVHQTGIRYLYWRMQMADQPTSFRIAGLHESILCQHILYRRNRSVSLVCFTFTGSVQCLSCGQVLYNHHWLLIGTVQLNRIHTFDLVVMWRALGSTSDEATFSTDDISLMGITTLHSSLIWSKLNNSTIHSTSKVTSIASYSGGLQHKYLASKTKVVWRAIKLS